MAKLNQNAPDNRRRAFADVVTIDAWHEPFEDGVTEVDLHAHVVFGTARIGAEADSPVRFRLSLRRAEVTVVIPKHEPVSVRKASVSRDQPKFEGRRSEKVQSERVLSGGLAAKSTGSFFDVNAAASGKHTRTETVEKTSTIASMVSTQTIDADGYYRWEIIPQGQKLLNGAPWSPDQARLRLLDGRRGPGQSLPPSVRVEVRCRREDISVEGVEVKDGRSWNALRAKRGFKNRMAAAVCYIRDALIREGLEVQNFEDPFGRLTIGSVLATHD